MDEYLHWHACSAVRFAGDLGWGIRRDTLPHTSCIKTYLIYQSYINLIHDVCRTQEQAPDLPTPFPSSSAACASSPLSARASRRPARSILSRAVPVAPRLPRDPRPETVRCPRRAPRCPRRSPPRRRRPMHRTDRHAGRHGVPSGQAGAYPLAGRWVQTRCASCSCAV
eukprot:7056939-Prymnesium_polylepis.2